MSLTTAEKFILLLQDPGKPRLRYAGPPRTVGIIGAILLDLNQEGRLVIENKTLVARSPLTKLTPAHQDILRRVADSGRAKKVKTWISNLSRRSSKYQKQLVISLQQQRILSVEKRSFLFIKYYNTRLIDHKEQELLLTSLKAIVFDDRELDRETAMIIVLIEACKLHKLLCSDRQELKLCRKKLKGIAESSEISEGVYKVVKEMQAAIATSVATAGATSAVIGS